MQPQLQVLQKTINAIFNPKPTAPAAKVVASGGFKWVFDDKAKSTPAIIKPVSKVCI
jgi:hypothetical protein